MIQTMLTKMGAAGYCGVSKAPEYSLFGGGGRCGRSLTDALEDITDGAPLDGVPQGPPLPNEGERCGVDQPLVPTSTNKSMTSVH